MSKAENWIQEITDTIGVGNITLQGGINNASTFANAFSIGDNNIAYSIEDGNNREAGLGTLVDANTFSRDNVRSTFENGVYTRGTGLTPITLSGNAQIACTFSATDFEEIQDHLIDVLNPHSVDASTVGLENCDNTSDANKPVSTAQQTALDLKEDDLGNPAADNSILASSSAGSRIWLPDSYIANPNLLDNPSFEVNQRQSATAEYFVDGAFIADRWTLNIPGVSALYTAFAADGYIAVDGATIEQVIEAYGNNSLAGKTVTLSCDTDGDVGANGVIDVDGAVPISGLLPLTGTIDAASPGNIKVRIDAPNSHKFKNAKLEISGIATPFRYSPFSKQLEICERYYQKSYEYSIAPGAVSAVGAIGYRVTYSNAYLGNAARIRTKRMMPISGSFVYSTQTGAIGNIYRQGIGDTVASVVGHSQINTGYPYVTGIVPALNEYIIFHFTAETGL